MSISSLQDLAFDQITVRVALRADTAKKGVLTRICLTKIAENQKMEMFNQSLQAVQGHVCILINYSVWHGSSLGPRKFRGKSLCKSKCNRLGTLCECDCGCIFKKILEFKEAEVFRGYQCGQRKHKKAPRFISKNTKLGQLLDTQFQDPRQ